MVDAKAVSRSVVYWGAPFIDVMCVLAVAAGVFMLIMCIALKSAKNSLPSR
jgi:hypothetical protein